MLVIFGLLELFIEPATRIITACCRKTAVNLPIVAWTKRFNALFAFNHDRERRRLHATDSGQLKSTGLGVERRHCTGAIDTDQPIRFAAAHSRVGQAQFCFIGQQRFEAFPDRGRCHRLQPQTFDRLLCFGELHDVTEN